MEKGFSFAEICFSFQYIRMIPWLKGSYLFVEIWVMINSVLPLLCMEIIQTVHIPKLVSWIILLYSFTRVLEITVYQINVLLFDPYQSQSYSVKSYRRLVILLLHNYIQVILWFAASYMVLSSNFEIVISKGKMLDTLFFSFITMVSFGSNSLTSIKHTGQLIIFIQAVIGLFMTIVSLARFIGLLPKPNSLDSSETEENLQIHQLTIEIEQLKEKVEQFATVQNKKED
jgi:hypothetical protein